MCQGHLLVLNDTILQLVLDDTILQMSVSSETESATVHLVSLWQRENSQNKQVGTSTVSSSCKSI